MIDHLATNGKKLVTSLVQIAKLGITLKIQICSTSYSLHFNCEAQFPVWQFELSLSLISRSLLINSRL